MAEKTRELSLENNERALLIVLLVDWLQTNQEESHCLYDEARETFQKILAL